MTRLKSTRPVRAFGDPSKVYKLRMLRNGTGIRINAAPTRQHIATLRGYGLSVESIAAAAGIGYTTVHKVEDGQALIDARIASAIQSVTWRPNPRQATCLAVGARRRVQALAAMGWPTGWISEQVGIRHPNLGATINKARCAYRHWAAVRDLYELHAMTAGPSDRARTIARRKGWPPPLAWDDDTIDDPCARPHLAEVTHLGAPGLDVEDVEFLLDCGENRYGIAARLQVKPDTVYQALRRAGRTDLLERLEAA